MNLGRRLRRLVRRDGVSRDRLGVFSRSRNGYRDAPAIPARLRFERRVEDALAGPREAVHRAEVAVAARTRVVGAVGSRVGIRPRHIAVAAVAAFVVGLALQALHRHSGEEVAAPAAGALRASVQADIPVAAPPAIGSVGKVAVPALRHDKRRHRSREPHRSAQVNTVATPQPTVTATPTPTPTATPPALVTATPAPTVAPPPPAPVSATPAPTRGPSFDSSG